jgi:hypothetical protein
MTTKTISLNISERVKVLTILNDFKGSLEKLAFVLEDIKQLVVTEEDWEKAERKIEPAPTREHPDQFNYTWNNEKGGEKEVNLAEVTVEYLRKVLKDKDEKGEFGLTDKPYIDIYNKLV